jgi:predicted enzyme related to lactoylglutathione lyase
MSNPVSWFEIGVTDLERAKKFYTEVFQIPMQFIDMPDAPMYMMGDGGESIGSGGALVLSKDNTPSTDGTIVYFTCEDVAVEGGRVEAAGGQLLFPKLSIGEFGFISQFIDTEGNRIGLHSNQ